MRTIKRFLLFVCLFLIIFSPLIFADVWWRPNWDHRIELNLTEEMGIDRENYAIIKNLTFPEGINDCHKEIRVTKCLREDSTCSQEKEIPVRILSGDNSTWCEIEFPINLSTNSWRRFNVYYGNKGAEKPGYKEYKVEYFVDASGLHIINETSYTSVSTVSENSTWITQCVKASSSGRVFHWNGSNWIEKTPPELDGCARSVSFFNQTLGFLSEHRYHLPDHLFKYNFTESEFRIDFITPELLDNGLWVIVFTNSSHAFCSRAWVGKVLEWNGGEWSYKKIGGEHVSVMGVYNETLVFGAGYRDNRYRWNKGNFTNTRGINYREYNDIDCVENKFCFSVGVNGTINRYTPETGWEKFDNLPIRTDIQALDLIDSNFGLAGTKDGRVLAWQGNSWVLANNCSSDGFGRVRKYGKTIDLLNKNYGWGVGNKTLRHRGSVSVEVMGAETEGRLEVSLECPGEVYLDSFDDEGLMCDLGVLYGNESLEGLVEENFDLNVSGVSFEGSFRIEEEGDGEYVLEVRDVYQKMEELGKFNLSLGVMYRGSKGKNETSFYLLKVPREGWIETEKDWKEIVGASATGWPVLVGEELKIIEKGEEYKVNDLMALEKMFLDDEKKIFVGSREKGIFAPRLARELNRVVVFEEERCGEECLDLEEKEIKEIEDLYLERLGKTDYFVLVNKNSEDFLAAGSLCVYRRGVPILVDLEGIEYPTAKDYSGDLDRFNGNNRVGEIKGKVKRKVNKFFDEDRSLEGKIPKLAIVGDGEKIPYYLVEDMGWEDFVKEPSGDELWLRTDSYYGDLNNDGFQDVVVGRIIGGFEQLKKIRDLEGEELEMGIGAEYNHPKGLDLITSGGSMLNGFIAESGVKDYETERIVERRMEELELEEELYKELKKIVVKSLSKKIGGYYYKISSSQEALYNLLERDWVNWEIPGVPGFLKEINKEKVRELIEENNVFMFFGTGDKNKIYFPDGSSLNLGEKEGKGFSVLDYSFSGFLDIKGAGAIGNTGILHDVASREFWSYFFSNLDEGIGRSFVESKNNLVKGFAPESMENLPKKEYYEKILLTDPGLNIFGLKEGTRRFYSAEEYKNKFRDFVEIKPEYEKEDGKVIFYNYSTRLIVPNKPMVPVYSKSIIIPSGAEIEEIEKEKKEKTIKGKIPIFRDEYYEKENFTDTYPEREYWKKEREFLDGRKEIIFSVPVVYKEGEIILNEFNFTVVYDSGLEIIDFSRVSVARGGKGFYLVIKSERERDAEVSLNFLDGGEIKKNVSLEKGKNEVFFEWEGEPGKGTVQVWIDSDVNVGPRSLDFEVIEKPNFLKVTANQIIKVWESFKERIRRVYKSDETRVEKEKPDKRLESWVNNGNRTTILRSGEFVLEIKESGKKRRIEFKSPKGRILIQEAKGNREEKIYGSQEIREEFERAMRILRKELKETR